MLVCFIKFFFLNYLFGFYKSCFISNWIVLVKFMGVLFLYGFYVVIFIVCDGFIMFGLLIVWEYYYYDKNVVVGNFVKDCFLDY